MPVLGHTIFGEGPSPVLVLHDWLGDRRNYEPMHPYLDARKHTYAFADFRGYGSSRDIRGGYSLDEAMADSLALADTLGWERFHLVGHSMSSLIVQECAARAPARLRSLSVLCPILPTGMNTPAEIIEFLESVGEIEELRRTAFAPQWGKRLSPQWAKFKLERWREAAEPAAAKAYARMYCEERVSSDAGSHLPLLAVVGEFDHEPFTEPTVRKGMQAFYRNAEIQLAPSAGHYPMQETPVALATLLERFFERHQGAQ
jgi:pimeloyl-ACP methyl ester carboxylesterase